MTSIVGILASDGVVIGADSSATFGAGQQQTIEQPCEKIDIFHKRAVLAGTGEVGLNQRFGSIVATAFKKADFANNEPLNIARLLCSDAIKDFKSTFVQKLDYSALVGCIANGEPMLCEFAGGSFQPELKNKNVWYVSMGCAQPITDPFLGFIREVFWQDTLPRVSEAVFAAYWTLDQAVKLNTGGVNGPIRIAAIRRTEAGKWRAENLSPAELGQHAQQVEACKDHLRQYQTAAQGDEDAADVPKPAK